MLGHVYILISTPEGKQPELFDSQNLNIKVFEHSGAMYDWLQKKYVNIDPLSIQTEGNVRWMAAYKDNGDIDRIVIRREHL